MEYYTYVKPRRFSAPSDLGLKRNVQDIMRIESCQKHEMIQRRASIAAHDNNNGFLKAATDIMDISPFLTIPQETTNVIPYYENDNDKIHMPNIPIPNLDDNNLSSPYSQDCTHGSLPRTKLSRRNVNHEDNNAEWMFESNSFSTSMYQVKTPPPASTPLNNNTFQPIIEEEYCSLTRNENYLNHFIIEGGENCIPPPPRGSYDTSLVQYLTLEVNDDGNNNNNESNHHLLLTELDDNDSDDSDMMVEVNTAMNMKIRTSNSAIKQLFVMSSTD